MLEYLSFRKFITPLAIQILFWIGVGVTTVEGISMIATGGTFRSGLGIVNGLLVLIVGPVVVRVLCEVLVAIFGIHASLGDGSM